MYDFAIELNLKDGRYSRMAFNPTGNVFIPYTGVIKMITSISFRNCFILKILKNLRLQLDFDVLSANYNNTPDYSGCECCFVGADGVAQWYEIRVYYWFGRSRVLLP